MGCEPGSFKYKIINEEKMHLVDEVRAVLEAFVQLERRLPNLGARPTVKAADEVVSLARGVLDMWWHREQLPLLQSLQKAALAVAKAADLNQDLAQTIAGARQVLEAALKKYGENMGDTQNVVDSPPFI